MTPPATDRREFWATAGGEEIAQACRDLGLRRGDPEVRRMVQPVTDLVASPGGARDRQLLRGQGFRVHALSDEGWTYGETVEGAYSGWIEASHLVGHPDAAPTHRVVAAQSYAKTTGGLKTPGPVVPLSMGSDLVVQDECDGWARIAWSEGLVPRERFVPSVHLAPIDETQTDPVAVAERLIGAPYLWGGNSAFGIDCSGLVQIACHACGIACPGDSDQQMARLGRTLPDGTAPRRGDLLFWAGHVGWVAGPDLLLHANAHHMAVAHEPLTAAIARIRDQGDGPVTRHARIVP